MILDLWFVGLAQVQENLMFIFLSVFTPTFQVLVIAFCHSSNTEGGINRDRCALLRYYKLRPCCLQEICKLYEAAFPTLHI